MSKTKSLLIAREALEQIKHSASWPETIAADVLDKMWVTISQRLVGQEGLMGYRLVLVVVGTLGVLLYLTALEFEREQCHILHAKFVRGVGCQYEEGLR